MPPRRSRRRRTLSEHNQATRFRRFVELWDPVVVAQGRLRQALIHENAQRQAMARDALIIESRRLFALVFGHEFKIHNEGCPDENCVYCEQEADDGVIPDPYPLNETSS